MTANSTVLDAPLHTSLRTLNLCRLTHGSNLVDYADPALVDYAVVEVNLLRRGRCGRRASAPMY